MRKIILIIIMSLGLSSTVLAQSKGDFELGFNVGFNTSSAASTNTTFDQGNGYNLGASIFYYFSSSWSLEAKLIYDQKGWGKGYIIDQSGNTFLTDFDVDYLTIPVMANYYFGVDEKKNWFIEFGPYIGFLLNAKETKFGNDVKQFLNKNDYGIALGGGVKIPLNDRIKIILEIEGQTGLANIFNDNSSMKNSRTGFNVGFSYLLK